MFSIGPIAFATPWILAALAVLPVIYWLLRLTPPSPRVVNFPALRLLRDLDRREETPAHTPWWLLLLRLCLTAIIILALARPLLNPAQGIPGSGPILLVVDNGWPSARIWAKQKTVIQQVLEQAEHESRQVMVIQTAPPDNGDPIEVFGPARASDARAYAETLAPQPWGTRHEDALAAINRLKPGRQVHTVWLSDGLSNIAPNNPTERLVDKLQHMGGLTLFNANSSVHPLVLDTPVPLDEALLVTARAPKGTTIRQPVVFQARAQDGRLLAQIDATADQKSNAVSAKISLPSELRNEISSIRILGHPSAAATMLLDEKWKRRPVGLSASGANDKDLPFLSQLYYLRRALAPFTEIHTGTINELLDHDLSVIILADIGNFTSQEYEHLSQWIGDGGVLLRFAGPTMANKPDKLVPVRLRGGGRTLEGAMTWAEPSKLAPFPQSSPFYGLKVPNDVVVRRQVLAEPASDLPEKTWAALEDGTPLVTAEARGQGYIVLVHTTANAEWSDLALSGLFVQMLERVIALSSGVADPGGKGMLQPVRVMDGFGQIIDPNPVVRPVAADKIDNIVIGPHHPPGFYGSPSAQIALNLAGRIGETRLLGKLPINVDLRNYEFQAEQDLKPILLAIGLILLICDMMIMLWMRGMLRPRNRGVAQISILFLLGLLSLCIVARPVLAMDNDGSPSAPVSDDMAITLSGQTWLAYVPSGDPAVDNMTRAGLEELARVIARRTAAEPAGTVAVNPEKDELSFFPLIYWPIIPEQKALSETATQNIQRYLDNGGMILFDTRDQQLGGAFESGGLGLGTRALRRITSGLDIPPLVPVPQNHVLTRAFYLLSDFPGRYRGGDLWVEEGDARRNDGVTSVLVGSNDWAAAWAGASAGIRNLPGGERQREMAYRFGVNLVMVALTGNYKTDQVHIPHILKRLGQ